MINLTDNVKLKYEGENARHSLISKGAFFLETPSNVANVHDFQDVMKIEIETIEPKDGLANVFGIYNNSAKDLHIKTLDSDVAIPEDFGDTYAISQNKLIGDIDTTSSITIESYGEPFNVSIVEFQELSEYDVLASGIIRVSEVYVTQGELERIYPKEVSVFDNTESFVGEFVTRMVTAEMYQEDLDGFDFEAPFSVVQRFYNHSESELINLDGEYAETEIGTFIIDMEESEMDDFSKTWTIVAYEDIGIYKTVEKMGIPPGLTGSELMTWITEQLDKEPPLYIGENPLFHDFVFEKINHNVDELTSYAYWIKAYAQLNMMNAYVINDRLVFVNHITDTSNGYIRQVDYDDPFEIGQLKLINTLVFEGEEAVEDPIIVTDLQSVEKHGEHDFKIVGNKLLNLLNREEIRGLMEQLLQVLYREHEDGYFYKPFSSDGLYINPTLGGANSTITLEDRDFNQWRAHITKYEWTHTPAIKGKAEGVIAPQTLKNFDYSQDVIDRLNMGIKVNAIDRTITSTIENIEVIGEQIENIEIGGRNYLLNSDERVDFEEQDVIPTTVEEYLPTEGGRNYVLNSNKLKRGAASTGIVASIDNNNDLQITVEEKVNGNWHANWFDTLEGIEDSFAEGDSFTISFLMSRIDGSGIPSIYLKTSLSYERMIGELSDVPSIVYNTRKWKKDGELLPHIGWSGTEGTFVIYKWKIEKGDTPTEYSPAPEDFNNLKGKSYALSQPLRKENTLSLNGSFEEDDFIGLWLGSDKFVGFLDNQELTFDLTENYDDEFVVVKTLSEKGIIDNAKLEKGNTTTDWTPAPEDIKSELDDNKNKIEDVIITTQENSSAITQTQESLDVEIAERKQMGDVIYEELSADMQLTKDEFVLEFTRIESELNEATLDINEWKTTYRLTEDGAIIGKSDSPFQFTVSNEQLAFLENGQATAWMNGQMMYIESVEILKSIIIGYHQFLKYDSGNQKTTLLKSVGSGEL